MTIVWLAFLVTALALVGAAWPLCRARGAASSVRHLVGGFLVALAAGTAVAPVLLPLAGVRAWVIAYVAFAAALAAALAVGAVVRARRDDVGRAP